MHSIINLILLLALSSLQASLSRGSALSTAVVPANSSPPVPILRYTFEDIWYDGFSWLEYHYHFLDLWALIAVSPQGPSANVDDFVHVRIEAFDRVGRRIVETTNIAGQLLWGPIHELPLPPPSNPYEPFSDQRFSFTLRDAFQIVALHGYASLWKDVTVIQFKNRPPSIRVQPIYFLNRAVPTPDCQGVVVGALSGGFQVYNVSSDFASELYFLNGTKFPIRPVSGDTA